MRALRRRWLGLLVGVLVILGPRSSENLAGGAYIVMSPDSPERVDLSQEVENHCSEKVEKKTLDGVVIQVLYPPKAAHLATNTLDMMERLHRVMAGDLNLDLRSGARVYLIELERYPPSLMVQDNSRHSVVFVLLNSGWAENDRRLVIEQEIYSSLAHEWTHDALGRMFSERSAVNRVRWISDGAASFFQYRALSALSQDEFDAIRAQHLPLFSLEDSTLKVLCAWEQATGRPADFEVDISEFRHYSAALGLFLRIAEHGGTEEVWRFLEEMRKLREPSPEETDEVLFKITGRRFADLAAISGPERESLYVEALAKLDSSSRFGQKYGLAVLSKYPERIGSHIAKLKEMEANADLAETIRAGAASLLAAQAPAGGQAP